MIDIPETVRRKAEAAGATDWLGALPTLLDDLAVDWGLQLGPAFPDATEACVLAVVQDDGTPAVLKVLVPRDGDAARHEITVLRLAGGDGCVALLRADESRGAMLLERLGPSLHDLGRPFAERLAILTDVARRVWRPVLDCGLPTGADKGRWLIRHIETLWDELDRPVSEAVIDHALASARRRIGAHDDERAVLVHGDVHEWNALQAGPDAARFVLVDPDGLVAEPEYDLGVLMREDPVELLAGDPWDRAHRLAGWTGLDLVAIWEWGVVERVSTGLLLARLGVEPVARQMLVAAERVAQLDV